MAETQVTQAAPDAPGPVAVRDAGHVPPEPPLSKPGFKGTGMSRRTLLQGLVGSATIVVGILGCGGDLVHDPVLGNGPFSWIRYGHGHTIANVLVYVGIGLLVWAWIRLGRDVLAHKVRGRGVMWTSVAWVLPMIISPPSFTRDVFSYLGEGEEALHHIDPYLLGPSVLNDTIALNVHPFWQDTPAPYGPLFILVAKGVVWATGEHLIFGVILMRLALMIGYALAVLAMPGLVRHLGGRLSVALWLVACNPIVVVHLIGGPHNDLLMVGLLAMGTLMVLERRHVLGLSLVTLGMAVKATGGVALPFLMWVWAGRMEGTLRRRFVKATAASLGVAIAVFGLSMLVSWQNFGWVGALGAPTLIVNWVNVPTGVGQILHDIVSLFGASPEAPFTNMTRAIGLVILAVIGGRQWWKARVGGAEAVRRMALVLLAVAVIAPPTLPWYFSWGMVVLCAAKWSDRWVAFAAGVSVLVLLVYYPDGESAMQSVSHMAWVWAMAILAAVSLLRYDPLGLSRTFRDSPKVPDVPPPAVSNVVLPRVAAPVPASNGVPNGAEPAEQPADSAQEAGSASV